MDHNYRVQFAHGMGLIPDDLHEVAYFLISLIIFSHIVKVFKKFVTDKLDKKLVCQTRHMIRVVHLDFKFPVWESSCPVDHTSSMRSTSLTSECKNNLKGLVVTDYHATNQYLQPSWAHAGN